MRRQLVPVLVGRSINQVVCGPPSYFFVTPPGKLKRVLVGQSVRDLSRYGKAIVASLSDGSQLLLHLGMTGQLVARALPQDGHVHLVLELGKSRVVSFRDVRKFGKVEWIAPGKKCARLDRLGPDALNIEPEQLWTQFRRRRIAVKTALLNQQVLAGVGNIYADEALHSAGIRPTRSTARLTRKEVESIAREVRDVLRRAVAHGGSTINDYLKPDGDLGGFQDWHQVYGKEGEACTRCLGRIVRKVVGARSTHFCPSCQR